MTLIKIKDQCLSELLKNDSNIELTPQELCKLDKLVWTSDTRYYAGSNKKIEDLEGIEHCTNVTEIDFSENSIKDMSPLTHLVKLCKIGLDSNKLEKIPNLNELTRLTTLNLIRNTKLADISKLSGHPSLKNLYLSHTKVKDIAPLATIPSLQYISLGNSSLEKIPNLGQLKHLKNFIANECGLSDISGLANHPSLKSLSIYKTNVSDITFLENLPKLNSLNIYYAPIDLSKDSPNYNTVIKLMQNGVDVRCENSEELKKTALATLEVNPQDDSLEAFLKNQGAFEVLNVIKNEGIEGPKGNAVTATLDFNIKKWEGTQNKTYRGDIIKDKKAVVARLIKEGAPVVTKNLRVYLKNGNTNGIRFEGNFDLDLGIVKLLVEDGAEITEKDFIGATCYSRIDSSVLDYLFEQYQGEMTLNLFKILCKNGDFKYVKSTIEAGFLEKVEDQATFLKESFKDVVFGGNTETIKYFLELGVNPNPAEGAHPFHEARHRETIDLFLDLGVDINTLTGNKWTLLMLLLNKMEGYRYDAAKHLIEKGINLNQVNANNGSSAAHILCWNNEPFVNFDERIYQGNMPTSDEKIELMKALADAGADLNIVNDDNQTARDLAQTDLKKCIVELGGITGQAALKSKV